MINCNFLIFFYIFIIFSQIAEVFSLNVTFNNSCNLTVWPTWTGNQIVTNEKVPLPTPEMQPLIAGHYTDPITFPTNITGRIWAREHCLTENNQADCQIGGCDLQQNCNGLSSKNTSLVEFTILENMIYYDISLGK